MNMPDLSDDSLAALHDALMAEAMLREQPDDCVQSVKALDDDEVRHLYDLTGEEIDRRYEVEIAASSAHVIEQQDARDADQKETDNHRLFVAACARLFKLAELNAPDPIIINAIKCVTRRRPQYGELYESQLKASDRK